MSRNHESVALQSVVNTIVALPAQPAKPESQPQPAAPFKPTAVRPLRPNLYFHLIGVISVERNKQLADKSYTPDYTEVTRELDAVEVKYGTEARMTLRENLWKRAIRGFKQRAAA